MDYGDAPKPYPTLRENDGARHVILSGFSLGAAVDINADGQPSTGADGDDNDGGDDEDGVVFDPTTPLVPNRNFTVTVITSGIVNDVVAFGVLDAWIDYNRDGDWLDAGERILTNVILNKSVLDASGTITFRDLKVPSWAVSGETLCAIPLEHGGRLVLDGRSRCRRSRRLPGRSSRQIPGRTRRIISTSTTTSGRLADRRVAADQLHQRQPCQSVAVAQAGWLAVLRRGRGRQCHGRGCAAGHQRDQPAELSRRRRRRGGSQPRLASTARSNHLEDVLRGEEDWLDIVADVDRSLGSSSASRFRLCRFWGLESYPCGNLSRRPPSKDRHALAS